MFNCDINLFVNSFGDKEVAKNFLNKNDASINGFIETAKNNNILTPDIRDLARLLLICKETKATSVIEYGCGFSSFVFHKYLSNFQLEFNKEKKIPNFFQIVEVHKEFLNIAKSRFGDTPNFLKCFYEISSISRDKYRNDGSHIFLTAYNFVPEIIYLDGPNPHDISHSNFHDKSERVPISSDVINIESWLEPATILIVDGRTANVRYLKRNLQRDWQWSSNFENDCSIAILREEPLGKKNIEKLKARGLLK